MIGRRAALLTCVVLTLAATADTGGFTSVSADRDVSVVAASDERAMPSVDVHDHELRNGRHEEVRLITLTNTFPTITSIEAEARSENTMFVPKSTGPARVELRAPLRVSEQATVTADITCRSMEQIEGFSIQISILTRSGTSVELTREATVECTGEPNRGESGRGNGGADERGGGSADGNGNDRGDDNASRAP